eukprot:CAMPEP_0172536088 /NCGR_PEP_ID=MMETSP1067-20121228/7904_1 /TAXON_ID=265564 ORGANISM="Thalassiosira punctigera, Strain Tpunct2005C2" /NCGR_SAMPLE_ID=MMETSP1067 /ASSEMBLY_ACC=CAM_ASM_000444 /LENGTH=643 /DNA_ID=CAMNT_0013321097 /DNA_START=198 /DNA_END=2129 /DNA_ORIENTATION=+
MKDLAQPGGEMMKNTFKQVLPCKRLVSVTNTKLVFAKLAALLVVTHGLGLVPLVGSVDTEKGVNSIRGTSTEDITDGTNVQVSRNKIFHLSENVGSPYLDDTEITPTAEQDHVSAHDTFDSNEFLLAVSQSVETVRHNLRRKGFSFTGTKNYNINDDDNGDDYHSNDDYEEDDNYSNDDYKEEDEDTADVNLSGAYLQKWMSRFASKTLFQIAIPGTHNSGAYEVTGLWDEGWNKGYIIPSLVAEPWAITQETTILGQLNLGARWLDLRLRFDDHGVLHTAHTYLMAPFGTVMDDVVTFTQRHPSEVVIVKLKPDDGGKIPNYMNWNHVKEVLSHYEPFAIPEIWRYKTLGDICAHPSKQDRKIVFVGDDPEFPSPVTDMGSFIWKRSEFMPKHWLNEPTAAEVCTGLEEIPARYNDNHIHVVMCHNTPDSDLLAKSLTNPAVPDNLIDVAKKVNQQVSLPYVKSLTSEWTGVISFDAPSATLMREVIFINEYGRTPCSPARPTTALSCLNTFCLADEDCAESLICDTNLSHGSWTCIEKKDPGGGCAYDSTCKSNNCFKKYFGIAGYCQCNECSTSGCGGCPSGQRCWDLSDFERNVCLSINQKFPNDHKCDNSGMCISGCCSWTAIGANTCEDDIWYRNCV